MVSKKQSQNVLPALLIAGKWGLYGGLLAYSALGGTTSIRTFSSGGLTFTGIADKTRDYVGAEVLILAALVGFIVVEWILDQLQSRMSPLTTESFKMNLLLANIPAAFALSGIFFANRLNLALILYSTAAEIVLFVCLTGRLLRAGLSPKHPQNEPSLDLDFAWVLPVLAFSLLAGALTLPSWIAFFLVVTHTSVGSINLEDMSSAGGWILAAAGGIASVIIFTQPKASSVAKSGCILLGLTQIALLAGGVRLLGPLLPAGDTLQYFLKISVFGSVCISLIMLTSIARTVGMIATIMRASDPMGYLKNGTILNPVAVVLAAIVLKVSFDLPTTNINDEYHTGEFALPYWALAKFDLLPYVNLDPARGWVNLIYGFFGEVLFKPAWANYAFMTPYLLCGALLFLFFALRGLIGVWAAFFLICLAPPPNNLTEIDLVITGIFCILCYTSSRLRPATWLVVWVMLGTGAVLFAPGQGGLIVVATGLLGAVRFLEAVQADRSALIRNAILVVTVGAILCLVTPLGVLIFGAVRYGIEQSSANTEMNGIAWKADAQVGHGMLWEAFRTSWLFVTVGIGIAVYLGLRRSLTNFNFRTLLRETYSPHFVVGVPIIILGILFVPRAAGRIDAGVVSRMGIASVWFVTILLPIYAFVGSGVRAAYRPVLILVFTALAGAFASLLNYTWTANPFDRMMGVGNVSNIVNGHDVGLDRLGLYRGDIEWVKKRVSMKAFIDAEIPEQGTFVDLTNRSGLYYLFNRRPPIEAAVYNLTNIDQQIRAIKSLQQTPPGLALAGPDAITHDGGAIGLRAPALFRYIIENYRPIEGGGAIWLKPLPPAALGQASNAMHSEAEMAILARAFGQLDLGALPRVWGDAWKYLSPQLTPFRTGDLGAATLHDAVLAPNGTIISNGPDTYAVLDVSALGMVGSEAGIVSFDFNCEGAAAPPVMEIYWTTARAPEPDISRMVIFQAPNGRIVVPVDASPSWVLGGKIMSVRFDLRKRASCHAWRISDLAFSQRSYLPNIRRMWLP